MALVSSGRSSSEMTYGRPVCPGAERRCGAFVFALKRRAPTNRPFSAPAASIRAMSIFLSDRCSFKAADQGIHRIIPISSS